MVETTNAQSHADSKAAKGEMGNLGKIAGRWDIEDPETYVAESVMSRNPFLAT